MQPDVLRARHSPLRWLDVWFEVLKVTSHTAFAWQSLLGTLADLIAHH